mgnify:CR=1 FL=1
MRIIERIEEMRSFSRQQRRQGKICGFVPTMGFLHDGHMALIRYARKNADFVVVSNFVNPTQFGPNEDYDRYPRDIKRDNDLCAKEGVDVVFYPSVEEMYFPDASVIVEEQKLSKGLCGAFRPGHFRGVTTVVTKLFNIVEPDFAVFGQKDAQQARVIQRMVRDLNIPVRIVVHPIVREHDGLAMSSRNVYLSTSERKDATIIYKSLKKAEEAFMHGERDVKILIEIVRSEISSVASAFIEYIALVDDITLAEVESPIKNPVLLAVAVKIGKTRLIDNVVLSP